MPCIENYTKVSFSACFPALNELIFIFVVLLLSRELAKGNPTLKSPQVDLRTLTFDVPPQEVLTKDSVTISVDAVVYYRFDL